LDDVLIRNYITVAIRNITRHKLFALINVGGLAVGLACCVLVILFVQREFAYNLFHEKSDRIYRVNRGLKDDPWKASPGVSGAWGPALQSEFPAVETIVRAWGPPIWVTANDRVFEERVCISDPNYFEVFNFRLIQGDPATVLREPGGAVISESMAIRFFGDTDAVGRTIVFEDFNFDMRLKVTGVMADKRHDTSWQFQFDCVTATLGTGIGREAWTRWELYASWRPIVTYVLMREGAEIDDLQEQMPGVYGTSSGSEHRGEAGISAAVDGAYLHLWRRGWRWSRELGHAEDSALSADRPRDPAHRVCQLHEPGDGQIDASCA
jgi:putative ABC transport system permease protein